MNRLTFISYYLFCFRQIIHELNSIMFLETMFLAHGAFHNEDILKRKLTNQNKFSVASQKKNPIPDLTSSNISDNFLCFRWDFLKAWNGLFSKGISECSNFWKGIFFFGKIIELEENNNLLSKFFPRTVISEIISA